MDLYLVRHGLSEGNEARRLQGWTGAGLSAAGQAQAVATGQWLARYFAARGTPVAGLYSSDTARAWETAQVIGQALGRDPQPEPRRGHRGDRGRTPDDQRDPVHQLLLLAEYGVDVGTEDEHVRVAVTQDHQVKP